MIHGVQGRIRGDDVIIVIVIVTRLIFLITSTHLLSLDMAIKLIETNPVWFHINEIPCIYFSVGILHALRGDRSICFTLNGFLTK